jgi:hypothetical protein
MLVVLAPVLRVLLLPGLSVLLLSLASTPEAPPNAGNNCADIPLKPKWKDSKASRQGAPSAEANHFPSPLQRLVLLNLPFRVSLLPPFPVKYCSPSCNLSAGITPAATAAAWAFKTQASREVDDAAAVGDDVDDEFNDEFSTLEWALAFRPALKCCCRRPGR